MRLNLNQIFEISENKLLLQSKFLLYSSYLDMKADSYLSSSFKRLNKKNDENSDDNNNSSNHKASSLSGRFKNSCLRKKRRLHKLRNWFIDSFLFKIASLFEAIALVSTLAFFLFSYGFHI